MVSVSWHCLGGGGPLEGEAWLEQFTASSHLSLSLPFLLVVEDVAPQLPDLPAIPETCCYAFPHPNGKLFLLEA